MIRLLLLTAALDLTGLPWDGFAVPLFDDDAGRWATSPVLWFVIVGLACMTAALGSDGTAGIRRLSMVRVLA